MSLAVSITLARGRFLLMLKYWRASAPQCQAGEIWRHGMCVCEDGKTCRQTPFQNMIVLVFLGLVFVLLLLHIIIRIRETKRMKELFRQGTSLNEVYASTIYKTMAESS